MIFVKYLNGYEHFTINVALIMVCAAWRLADKTLENMFERKKNILMIIIVAIVERIKIGFVANPRQQYVSF